MPNEALRQRQYLSEDDGDLVEEAVVNEKPAHLLDDHSERPDEVDVAIEAGVTQPLPECLRVRPLKQAVFNVKLERAQQLIEEESQLLLRVELRYELVNDGPPRVHRLLVDRALLLDELGEQEAHDDRKHVGSVLLCKLRDASRLLYLLLVLLCHHRVGRVLSVASGATKVDDGDHVFELGVISEALEHLAVLPEHTAVVSFEQAVKRHALELRVAAVEQSEHRCLKSLALRRLPEALCLLEQLGEAVKLVVSLPSVGLVALRVDHVCIGHLV